MKTHLIILLSIIFSGSVSFGQTANSLDEAMIQGTSCSALTINGSSNYSLPKNLSICNGIKTLNFTNNVFLDIEDGLYLPSVEELNLSGTYINTWEMHEISAAFPNLKRLNLSGCGLSFVGKLSGFSKLEQLDLSNNKLEVLPDDLQYLSNLNKLDVSGNQLGNNVGVLGYLWQLRTLNTDGNPNLPSSSVLRAISMNRSLRELTISYDDSFLEALPLLDEPKLETLILEGSNISLPKRMEVFSELSTLGFKNNSSISDPNKSIPGLKKLNTLAFVNAYLQPAFISNSKVETVEVQADGDLLRRNIKSAESLKHIDTLDLRRSSATNSELDTLQKAIPETTILSNELSENLSKIDEVPVTIIAPEINTFTVKTSEPSKLEVENVLFDIPKNAFLDANGNPVQGDVKVDVTVFNDPVQIALAGTPMTFDNNGVQETFSSQGMLRFDAFDSKGNKLVPNPSSLINVSITNLQPNTTGGLYYFNDSTSRWENSDSTSWGGFQISGSSIQAKLDSINQIDYKALVKVQGYEPVFRLRSKYNTNQSYVRIDAPIGSTPRTNDKAKVYTFYQQKNGLFQGQKLYIDSVVSRRFIEHIQYRNRFYSPKHRNIRDEEQLLNEPRKISNVRIYKEENNDRYRLSFQLEDTTYNIPVVLNAPFTKENISIRSSRSDNVKFEFDCRMAVERDNAIQAKIDSEMDKIIDSLAKNLKSIAISSLYLNENRAEKQAQMERMGFPLTKFGLVNCDFFTREIPVGYASIDSVLTDQNDITYNATQNIRVVYVDKYTYVEQPSERIGLIEGSKEIGIMILSATTLGIIDFLTNSSHRIKKIRTIDIEGKSPDEVNRLVYGK